MPELEECLSYIHEGGITLYEKIIEPLTENLDFMGNLEKTMYYIHENGITEILF